MILTQVTEHLNSKLVNDDLFCREVPPLGEGGGGVTALIKNYLDLDVCRLIQLCLNIHGRIALITKDSVILKSITVLLFII